ncbi:nucleotidyltransferase domain-containing protein [Acinetobacter bereziniae]|uniref:nucleotidyltransferase domain-containing protein n=1 Tax=Acinetobacter bereziniae TaxID=106648 RepID=UPI0018DD1613|nr:nucleotidyltransferase domain-containing protein [Acinetobacter bereziniae]MBI0394179.1 nucleotidyltransferase domain-containing protein [Acinetobacter bereziniae]
MKDSEIQYQRDGAQRIIDSSISAAAPIVSIGCDAAGGSYHNCTGAGNVAATFTGALGSAFVGKVITPIATSKNEINVQKVEPEINTGYKGKTNVAYSEKSIFNKYPSYTELKFNSLDEQAKFLSNSIEGLSVEQAKIILEAGVSKNTSIVIGGSRVRGNNSSTSDIDIGFGSLNANQAWKAIQQIQKKSNQLDSSLKLEETRIVPGNSTTSIPTIKSPEEFFQRNGIRGAKDEKAGQVYFGSGAVSVFPDGRVIITPPNYKDK